MANSNWSAGIPVKLAAPIPEPTLIHGITMEQWAKLVPVTDKRERILKILGWGKGVTLSPMAMVKLLEECSEYAFNAGKKAGAREYVSASSQKRASLLNVSIPRRDYGGGKHA